MKKLNSKYKKNHITFNAHLLNEVRKGIHVLPNISSGAKSNEIKFFLDFNQLFGGMKPSRLAETFKNEEI